MSYLPNVLSASRYVMALPMGYLTWQGHWAAAACVLWLAIGTDILDGWLARRLDSASPLGGLLDHSSDAVFVTITLLALVSHQLIPAALPLTVAVAFVQYMLDSKALAGQPLRASHLGRYNGICYFILGGFPVMQHALGLYPVPDHIFPWLGWGLVLTTVISMTDRALAMWAGRS